MKEAIFLIKSEVGGYWQGKIYRQQIDFPDIDSNDGYIANIYDISWKMYGNIRSEVVGITYDLATSGGGGCFPRKKYHIENKTIKKLASNMLCYRAV